MIIRRLLLLFLCLLIVLIGLLFYIGTESGTRLVWNIISDQFPEQISAEKLEGKLSDSVRLANLNIKAADLNIDAQQIVFTWQPTKLFDRKLIIEQLNIQGLNIDDQRPVTTSEGNPKSAMELPEIDFPLAIEIKKLELSDVTYQSTAQRKPLTLDLFSLALTAENKQISISQLHAKAMDAELDLQGGLQTRGDYPLDFTINWLAKLPANQDQDPPVKLSGNGQLQGSLEDLQITHQLTTPALVKLNAQLTKPLSDLNWDATIKCNDLLLQKLKEDLPEVSVSADIYSQGNLQELQLQSDYSIESKEFKNWDGHLELNRLAADPKNILLNTLMIKARELDAQINFNGALRLEDKPEVNLTGNWKSLAWPLSGEAIASSDQGNLQISGNVDAYQLQINTIVNHAQIGDVALTLNGKGDSEHFVLQKLTSDLLSGQLITQGKVNWVNQPLKFDLNGDWKNIVWQQTVEETQQTIKTPQGKFSLSGTTEAYKLNLQTKVGGSQIPNGDWTIAGRGTNSTFDLQSLHGESLGGTIDLLGKLGWGEKLTWQMKLDGKDIDPGILQKDWPGKLTISSTVSGQQLGDKLSATIENTHIKGQLRDYPFNLETTLDLADNTLAIKELNLSSGKSTLAASGQAGELLDLDWHLKSPNLAELYPDASGQLTASGSVKGSQKQPLINTTIQANKVRVSGLEVAQLSSDIKVDLAQLEKTNAFDIKLNSTQIKLGENIIKSLSIKGDGSLATHTVKVDLNSSQGDVLLLATGGLENDAWSGSIKQLDLSEKNLGNWKLAKAEPLNASSKKADLKNLCLTQKQARICLGGHWQKNGTWLASSNIDQLPLSLFSSYLPPKMQLDGTLSSTLNAQGVGNKKVVGKLALNLPAGSVFFKDAGSPIPIKYDQSNLNIVLDDKGAKADLLLQLLEPSKNPITFNLSTPTFDLANFDINKLPLKGHLKSKIDDLSFVQKFTDQLEKIKGNLDIDMDIHGTLEKPVIKGHTKLDAAFFLYAAGLDLQDVKINVSSADDDNLAINGQVKSGDGILDIKGNINLIEDGLPVHMELKADRLEVINLPEAWLLASPNLNIDYKKNNLSIDGEIVIPEAKLEPQGIASSVPISSDVTIINNPEPAIEKESPLQLSTNVKIILGDKISLSSLGFGGNLAGSLLVTGKPKKPMLGSGEIVIKNGLFDAYGQNLDIDKGRIIFAGGPIDSPNIDLKASRKINEITAGVHATGAAAQPELTLFSSPQMNEDDILSYMLIGRPLREASGSDGQLLSSAASSLGFKGAGALTSKIGQSLGLDEFSIAGGDNGAKDASLKVGKYLTPKLYIGYGVGLFETITNLNIRYDFSKRWSMEAESGTNSAMDMLYKYER